MSENKRRIPVSIANYGLPSLTAIVVVAIFIGLSFQTGSFLLAGLLTALPAFVLVRHWVRVDIANSEAKYLATAKKLAPVLLTIAIIFALAFVTSEVITYRRANFILRELKSIKAGSTPSSHIRAFVKEHPEIFGPGNCDTGGLLTFSWCLTGFLRRYICRPEREYTDS